MAKQNPALPDTGVSMANGYPTTAYHIFFNTLAEKLNLLAQFGLAADRPAADSVYPGTLYKSTDTGDISISDGLVWN